MATYMRSDGSTPDMITRALNSVFSQTYKNYKIFVIGDKYEDDLEIRSILSKYEDSKIYFENLNYAKERDIYTGKNLWSYGGVNATNIAIDKATSEGFEYICHLDHDDWWYDNHLEVFYDCIKETKSNWMCTKAFYGHENRYLPNVKTNKKYTEYIPKPEGLIHSSVCMNFKELPFRYRDLINLYGKRGLPADADLWQQVGNYMNKNKSTGIFIDEITCRHEQYGFELRKS